MNKNESKNISREGSKDGGDFEITINQFLFFKIVPNWLPKYERFDSRYAVKYERFVNFTLLGIVQLSAKFDSGVQLNMKESLISLFSA